MSASVCRDQTEAGYSSCGLTGVLYAVDLKSWLWTLMLRLIKPVWFAFLLYNLCDFPSLGLQIL